MCMSYLGGESYTISVKTWISDKGSSCMPKNPFSRKGKKLLTASFMPRIKNGECENDSNALPDYAASIPVSIAYKAGTYHLSYNPEKL